MVTKLFSWIRPNKAIFGQKDFIQCIVIKNLCREFFPDTQIIVHPTMREKDGLAMSSRNNKLTVIERNRAPLIYQCLSYIACYLFDALNDGNNNPNVNINTLRKIGEKYCEMNNVKLEYISFHDFTNGSKLNEDKTNFDLIQYVNNNEIVISIAGSVGESTRLIDNIVIGGKGKNKILWDGIKQMEPNSTLTDLLLKIN